MFVLMDDNERIDVISEGTEDIVVELLQLLVVFDFVNFQNIDFVLLQFPFVLVVF